MEGTELTDDLNGINDDLGRISKGQGFMSRTRQKAGLSPHVIPMTSERAIYEYLRSVYPAKVVITESFIRSVVPIPVSVAATTLQKLTFNLTKNDNTSAALDIENKLDQSDTFEALQFRLGIYTLPVSAGGVLTADHATAIFEYFNNNKVFTTATEIANLNAIYNGSLYVKIGDTVYFEQYPAENFKKVAVSQRGVAVSTVATTGVIGMSSGDYKDMSTTVTPVIMIDGSGKNEFTLNLPFAVDLSAGIIGTATRQNFVVFECRGFKCQGGAKQGTLKFKLGKG